MAETVLIEREDGFLVKQCYPQNCRKNFAITAGVAVISALGISVIFGPIAYVICKAKVNNLKLARLVTIVSSIGSFSLVFGGSFGIGAMVIFRKRSADVMEKPEKTELDRLYDQLYEEIGKLKRGFYYAFNTKFRRIIPIGLGGLTISNRPMTYPKLKEIGEEIKEIEGEQPKIIQAFEKLSMRSSQGLSLIYRDEEILFIYKLYDKNKEKMKEYATYDLAYTRNGKAVYMQEFLATCWKAVVFMLMIDNGANEEQIKNCYATERHSDSDEQKRIFKEFGFSVIETIYRDLNSLKESISLYGPAIVTIDEGGGHYIIVDDITEDGVDIREPFHGWAIRITKEAFLRTRTRYCGTTILHVDRNQLPKFD